MHRPLVITEDQELLDDLLRVAAAAGVEIDVAHAAAHARPYWKHAPLVVVGADAADALAATGPPSRPGVLLVTRASDDPAVWRRCVAVGAQELLRLPSEERRLVDELAEASEPSARAGETICVIGGRGGSGASVLAASLALWGSRRGLRSLLIDADPLGGGIDVVLGQEQATGARWPDIAEREGRVSFAALQKALPTFGELTVLSWHRGESPPIPPEAMRAVLGAAHRGCDLIVVDLPRHIGPAAAEALSRAASTLLLVPADVRGVLAASQVLIELRRHTSTVAAVARAGTLHPDVISTSLGIPCAGVLPDQRGVSEALNRGDAPPLTPRTPLARFCTTYLTPRISAHHPTNRPNSSKPESARHRTTEPSDSLRSESSRRRVAEGSGRPLLNETSRRLTTPTPWPLTAGTARHSTGRPSRHGVFDHRGEPG
ncbi:septum formation initiator [Sphaerisporangium siamense]|uniref:Secretion/DNA translocation related CpaE-like protein n=1 Tax=Sphaerisporangium siamense TaxID=795645 RepID=A0A7W7G7F3_9ACTN|nr:septum site-determining protein Ssd [Sphaerisporangium siamense]MBB4699067.1 secretion/DNA translocation related CpaE-like protein [Sphaerisporangium siamense]GII86806.1 septum formation initiator [Sphaerisporangium siamense]